LRDEARDVAGSEDEDLLALRLLLLLLLEESDEEEEEELYLFLLFLLSLSLVLRSLDRLFATDFDFSRYLRLFSRSLSESDEYRDFLRAFSRLFRLELFGISSNLDKTSGFFLRCVESNSPRQQRKLTEAVKLLNTAIKLQQFLSKATFAFQKTSSSSTQIKIMADLGLGGDSKVDPELQEFLMLEKQKAQVNAQVN
jgi:hypothetical protein